jgi:hypothetical protein
MVFSDFAQAIRLTTHLLIAALAEEGVYNPALHHPNQAQFISARPKRPSSFIAYPYLQSSSWSQQCSSDRGTYI